MTIDEIIEINEGNFDDLEIYLYKSEDDHGFQSGYISDRAEALMQYDYAKIEWEIMDEKRYNETVFADKNEVADFGCWYDDKDAKVLCIRFDPFALSQTRALQD